MNATCPRQAPTCEGSSKVREVRGKGERPSIAAKAGLDAKQPERSRPHHVIGRPGFVRLIGVRHAGTRVQQPRNHGHSRPSCHHGGGEESLSGGPPQPHGVV